METKFTYPRVTSTCSQYIVTVNSKLGRTKGKESSYLWKQLYADSFVAQKINVEQKVAENWAPYCTVMDHIFLSHGHRISQWNFDILSPPMLQEYADVIHAKGAPLNNCFGFIAGTVRPISRPGQHQRIVYNGHKRVHSLKFQSVHQWTYWKYVWACW